MTTFRLKPEATPAFALAALENDVCTRSTPPGVTPDSWSWAVNSATVVVKILEVLIGGIVYITAIVAVAGAAIYALWWCTLIAIRRIPMIGKRHRHARWDRLNRP